MLKAYKYRIYPNQSQKNAIVAHFGCARFVYNWALAKRKTYYEETKKKLSKREIQDELVYMKRSADYSWLCDVNSQTLLAALDHVDRAFRNFFKGHNKFPVFKKKNFGKQSFQCPQHVSVNFETQHVNLPKIKGIKTTFHRQFKGVIKTCTISKTSSEKYFISILVEDETTQCTPQLFDANKVLGLDLGIQDFLVSSDGVEFSNPKYLESHLNRLKKLQRSVSKKQKGSSNRRKAVKKLAIQHEKIANQRKNMAHQLSHKLVFKNQATSYAIEDLNIKGMMQNKRLSQTIGSASWGMFLNILAYKASWSGKQVIKINRWYPSSKICSNCGSLKEKLSLSERIYNCEHCNLLLDRDHNAAINIKLAAIKQKLGQDMPEIKPADHALAGDIQQNILANMR